MSGPNINSDLIFQVYRLQQTDQISKSELYDMIIHDLNGQLPGHLLSTMWYLSNQMAEQVNDTSCLCILNAFVSLLKAIHQFKIEYAIDGTPQ
jgi:hypothetical protein